MKKDGLLVSAFVAIGALIYGCGGGGDGGPDQTEAKYHESLLRIGRLATGTLMYAADYDDFLPPAGTWMDGTGPYVHDEAAYVSPALDGRATQYGYALNSAIAGVAENSIADPYNTVLIFDSTVLTRNATASTDTMPSPPRYGTHNTIAYATGRVQDGELVNPQTLGQVATSRLRHLAVGTMLYASDHDDRLPLADHWYEGTFPYVRVDPYYRSPALADNPDAYGFALNSDVAGHSLTEFESPTTTPGLFDSTVLTRNATAPIGTLPNPARYEGGNVQSFLDGHVKQVP